MHTFRVIGPGRAGQSLTLALAAAGWTALAPVRRGEAVAAAARDVDLLVIATPDADVAAVAAAVEPVASTVVAHLAGSLGLDVLAPHARRAALHPLVALPDPELGAQRLRAGAWFAVAGDPLAAEAVEALGGRAVTVADGDRAAYHAAACIASNHLVGLLAQAERVAAAAGVPLDAFLDLAGATVDNVRRLGPAGALTGPVARGDRLTVDRHRAALGRDERTHYDAGVALVRHLLPRVPDTPEVIDTVAGFTKALEAERAAGRTIGLVPTMGYLHDGHASLIRRAREENDVVALTIFVNPLQFSPTEDLSAYPRDLDADLDLAAATGADYVFAPPVEEMYPGGRDAVRTTVSVAGVSQGMEGASRPTHFDGVATVVTKLFAMAGACRAYFGEKDFQQLAVIRRMVHDLSFPVELVACPTVREDDGLARSSRNVYLTAEERAAAPVLHRALLAGREAIAGGERDADRVRRLVAGVVAAEPLATLDYVEVVDSDLLTPLTTIPSGPEVRLLIAARFGRARLIDNLGAQT